MLAAPRRLYGLLSDEHAPLKKLWMTFVKF